MINSTGEKATYNILVLHQLIQGSKVEHYTFRHGDNVIDFAQLNLGFHLLAVGHVHRYQFLYTIQGRIKSSHSARKVIQDIKRNIWTIIKNKNQIVNQNPIICYPGSCEKVSMMERNESKGYVIGCINNDSSKAYLEF